MSKQINSIEVLGSGCPSCQRLFELTKEAVKNLNLNVIVTYSDDIQKIINLGLMSSPVLTINNQAILVGSVPGIENIKTLINNYLNENKD